MYNFNLLKEYIHGDRFRSVSDVVIDGEPTYEQAEFILNNDCIIFCKTDYIFMLFEIIIESKFKYVLITHNSDFGIDARYYDVKPESVMYWFALNVAIKRPNLIPLPSGMERPLGGGYSSDVTVLTEQWKTRRETKNLVYMNHNANNNHDERDYVTELLKDKPWVTWRPHGVSFKDYISNVYNHCFVISPQGNGIDCHRTWETLYMGSIPIVKRSHLTEFFSALPILIVEDWSVITEELLSIVYDEIKSRDYDYSKLTLSFWEKEILIAKDLLNDGGQND